MGNIFAASEIIEIGIQIEKNGKDFYNAACRRIKKPQVIEIFKFLAGEEEKHIQLFEALLEKNEKYEPQGDIKEYFDYMSALAGDYVFTKRGEGLEIAGKITGDMLAVDMGIGFEKDSIIFYEGMKKAVPAYSLNVVEELIHQEQLHLSKLIDLKKHIA